MAPLQIRCPNTQELVNTGMDMDDVSFEGSTLENNATQCSACGEMHTWSKKDVVR